jgi:hypothetical protein
MRLAMIRLTLWVGRRCSISRVKLDDEEDVEAGGLEDILDKALPCVVVEVSVVVVVVEEVETEDVTERVGDISPLFMT